METQITVTKWDIYWGERGETKKCPIARAIRKKLKAKEALITHSSARILFRKKPTILSILPAEARVFIREFDNNQKVKPFKFTIEI